MGRPQFTMPVQNSQGNELDTSTTYPNGGDFNKAGGTYPYTLNPAETIQELVVTKVGDIEMDITTTGGQVVTVDLDSPAVFNRWEIDSVDFRDPNNTSAQLAASWAGK